MKFTIKNILFLVFAFISCKTQSNLSENSKQNEADLNSFLTSKNEYVNIQMQKMSSQHLLLHAVVNGIPGRFILDTGAGMTVIDKNRQSNFNLVMEDTLLEAVGGGGFFGVGKSIDNTIQFDKFQTTKQIIYIMDLSTVNSALQSAGEEIVDGVIGGDILSNHHAVLDYSKLVLYLKMNK